MSGWAVTARAVTAADADTLFEAHTKAFYRVQDGKAWFKESTEGGKASYWMRAEQMEMVLDAYERTKKPEQMEMFTQLFRGFVADHGATWEKNPFNDDIMWMVIACARAHLLSGNGSSWSGAEELRPLLRARRLAGPGRRPVVEDGQTLEECLREWPRAIAAFLLGKATAKRLIPKRRRSFFFGSGPHCLIQRLAACRTTSTSTGRVGRAAFTYNQGTFVGAANLLGYHDEAKLAATFTMNQMSRDGFLPASGENGDGGGFNGIAVRWIARFMRDRASRRPSSRGCRKMPKPRGRRAAPRTISPGAAGRSRRRTTSDTRGAAAAPSSSCRSFVPPEPAKAENLK
jgi:hypothetical protein